MERVAMKSRLYILLVIAIILVVIILPITSAKKSDNPTDTTKFKQQFDMGSMDAYDVLSNGGLGNKLNKNNPNMNTDKTIHFETSNGSVIKVKKIYVHSKSTVILSNDSDIVMQTSKFKNSPTLELYYGYEQGLLQPWKYYYRVDDCDVTCRVIHADFLNRSVWITFINETTVNDIVDLEQIPTYEELP
jgi:hypothetical protein